MNRVGINAVGKVRANRARGRLLRICCAHEVTVFGDRILALEDLDHDRTSRPPLSWRLAACIVPGALSLWAWAEALGPVAGPCAGLVAWMLMLATLPWALLPGQSAREPS